MCGSIFPAFAAPRSGRVVATAGRFGCGKDRAPSDPVFGLRLYMDTFVVRLDAGLGKETTGFFLNFGQLF
jgi:hypothetical protein